MAWSMSSNLPTVILAPNPPVPDGHRKASTAAPKPDRLRPIVVTIARLKKVGGGDLEGLGVGRDPGDRRLVGDLGRRRRLAALDDRGSLDLAAGDGRRG